MRVWLLYKPENQYVETSLKFIYFHFDPIFRSSIPIAFVLFSALYIVPINHQCVQPDNILRLSFIKLIETYRTFGNTVKVVNLATHIIGEFEKSPSSPIENVLCDGATNRVSL